MFSIIFMIILELVKAIGLFFIWFFLLFGSVMLVIIGIIYLYDKLKGEKKVVEFVFEPTYINQKQYQDVFKVVDILTNYDEKILNEIKHVMATTEQFEGELEYGVDHFICNKLSTYSDKEDGFEYGVALDSKEIIQNGIDSLIDTIVYKKYEVDLSKMDYSEDDSIEDLLGKGNAFLTHYGLSLVNWDIGSDTYYLFVLKSTHLDKLVELGNELTFKFECKLTDNM